MYSLIVIILLGTIAYFHYVQGLFSATLSAILAVVAAVLAFSYHETVVDALLKGKFADQAHAMVLVAMFAGIYIVLRLIFDKLVPGNLRFPAIVDRIGGAVMGIFAGLFALGVVTVAAQELPFGPEIAGYGRYEIQGEYDATVPRGTRQALDAKVYDSMRESRFEPGQHRSLAIPVDDLLLGLVGHLSDDGSLAGDRRLRAVHPHYIDELFASRLGLQTGAKTVAMPDQVKLAGVYTLDKMPPQVDGDIPDIRGKGIPPLKYDPPRRDEERLIVVRLTFDKNGSDSDNLFRISPAGIRLVAAGENYYPLGTIAPGGQLVANRIDDPIFIGTGEGSGSADFAFIVPTLKFFSDARAMKPRPGAFIEVKRLARLALPATVSTTPPAAGKLAVMYKPAVLAAQTKTQSAAPAAPAATIPFVYEKSEFSDKLFTPINVETPERQTPVLISSGSGSLKDRAFDTLTIEPVDPIGRLRMGEQTVERMHVPAGMVMLQLSGAPPAGQGDDAWAWANRLGEFSVIDSAGKRYPAHGGWAKVRQGAQEKMVAAYSADAPITQVPTGEGRPTDIVLAFLVPSGVRITESRFGDQAIATLDRTVP